MTILIYTGLRTPDNYQQVISYVENYNVFRKSINSKEIIFEEYNLTYRHSPPIELALWVINSIDKILEDLQMLDITEMMYRELWNAVKTLKESKITYNKQIISCIEYGEYLLNTCAVLTLHFL